MAGNHVTQQQQQWPIFEKNPQLQVRNSSIIPLIHDRLEFGLKHRRWKDSRDLLDVLDFLNNTWSKSYWRANKFFTLDNCLLVNNFFIRCCLKNLTHQANPRSPSAFSASNQIPIGHVLTELLKIFLPEVGGFFSNVGHCCCRCVTWFPAVSKMSLLTFTEMMSYGLA